ncbi:AfsR/SARP family transcriptional regulator [Actinokineospora globicatena]|uniref:DNA-binding transcriptional activator of the SARP family n=1 Tax=Actinokineospora globicatena TaxID=103729 RepID=A0A9W6QJZ3_9PSEU|nr:BTAD domain-containing putative transcriptional regulator [Actinokineospora globicatena]GLW89977.1 hypothetical protein Aglo03_07930 [Actinokineospora globicatena]
MEFLLLGPLEARHAGTTIDFGGQRRRAVLAALLLRANSLVDIGYLANATWDRLPAAPESNIRTHVAGLRRALREFGDGDARLVTGSGAYRLVVEPAELDLLRFRDFAARGNASLRAGEPEAAMADLSRALGLWRGEPLTGLGSPGAVLLAETARLADLRLTVVEQHATAAIGAGRADLVVDTLGPVLAEHPLRESLWVRFVQALHQCGRTAEALEAFAKVRGMLVAELGIEPGPLLRQTHQRVLTAAPAPRPRVCGHLPVDPGAVVGREEEMRLLRELAGDGRSAVVCSIEGMAGIGKTRLALRAARQFVEAFTEIALWVDLRGFDADHAPLDPFAALESLLRGLGVSGHEVPPELASRAALFQRLLRGRRAVIVLDNAGSAEQVRPLLPGTAGSLVLITTRRGLANLDGSRTVALDVLPQAAAVELLAGVAGRERITSDPLGAARIAELCGHLPIALTLAARRFRPQWTVRHLADHLDNPERLLCRLSTRSRDLHTLFDLSYRALQPAQQRLFRILGLHPGPDFDADSAAILGDLTTAIAESLLDSLVDENLLHHSTPGRYHFNPLLRAYAHHRAHMDESLTSRRSSISRFLDWNLHAAAPPMVSWRRQRALSE